MKNYIMNATLLVAMVAIFVAGCGTKEEDPKPQTPTPSSTTLVTTKPPKVAVSINDSLRYDATILSGVDWTDKSKDSVAVLSDGSLKTFLTVDEYTQAKKLIKHRLVDFNAKGYTYRQWYTDPTTDGQVILVYHIVGVNISYKWFPKDRVKIANNDFDFTGSPSFQVFYGSTRVK